MERGGAVRGAGVEDTIGDEDAEITQRANNVLNKPTAIAESMFSADELGRIKKEFEKLSKDQIIGKRKLLEYFRLMEINDTYLTNELFYIIKNSS